MTVLLMAPDLRADETTRPDAIPSVIVSSRNDADYPVWVAADAAFDANGDLHPSLFSPTNRSIIDDNRQLNAEAAECKAFAGAPHESYAVSRSFDDAVGNALTILSGEVVAVQQGFYTGLPGSLVAIRISERLKTLGRADAAGDRFYVFLQQARIPTKKGLVCASTFDALPVLAPGDDIVVFADLDPVDRAGLILDVDPRTGLVVVRGDTTVMPKIFEGSSIRTVGDLLSAVRIHPRLHTVRKEKH